MSYIINKLKPKQSSLRNLKKIINQQNSYKQTHLLKPICLPCCTTIHPVVNFTQNSYGFYRNFSTSKIALAPLSNLDKEKRKDFMFISLMVVFSASIFFVYITAKRTYDDVYIEPDEEGKN